MKKRRDTSREPDLSALMGLDDLTDAPLLAVLLHGLAVGGEDPIGSILMGLRSDLETIARLAEGAEQVAMANTLDGLRHRLEVAIELHRRTKR